MVALVLSLVVAIGTLAAPAGAATTVVSFEAFDDGRGLTTEYEGSGVVFEPQAGQDAGVIVRTCGDLDPECEVARTGQQAAITPEEAQTVTPTPIGGPTREPLVATFTEPQRAVSLYVQDGAGVEGTQLGTLLAFDASGELVARDVVQFQAGGTSWFPLSVETDTAAIASVRLTLADADQEAEPHNVLVADDLTFQRNERPAAVFDVVTADPTVDEPVEFDASAADDPDGEIVEYRWDFNGDGTFERVTQQPTVAAAFQAPGTYPVTLVVEDDRGAAATFVQRVTVGGNPIARCTVTDTRIETDETVVIDASASDAELVRFDVDGDGDFDRTNQDDFREFVSYDEAGTYQPEVRAEIAGEGVSQACPVITVSGSDGGGGIGPDVVVGGTGGFVGVWVLRSVYKRIVNGDNHNGPNTAPTAVITSGPDEPAPGQPVVFDGTASYDSDTDDRVVGYRWTVGDRETQARRFVHLFPEADDHDVSLEVIDSHGAVGTAEETVTVAEREGELALAEVHPDAPGDDHEQLLEEYLVFENAGDAPLDLAGWTVHDTAEAEGRVAPGDHTFTFPEGFKLDPGATVTVHTGPEPADRSGLEDTDEALHRFWGKDWAVWNNDEDEIVVQDASGHPALAVRYTRSEDEAYDLERVDVEVLEGWFPEVVLSRRDEAGPVSVDVEAESAVSVLLGIAVGMTFLRGPKAFLHAWANVTGFVLSSSLTWALTTVTGFLPPSIEAVIPLVLSMGSVFMLLVGGVVTAVHAVLAAILDRLT